MYLEIAGLYGLDWSPVPVSSDVCWTLVVVKGKGERTEDR